MQTEERMTQATGDNFRDQCRELVAEIRAALGEGYFTKGRDVHFIELVPDGWEGEPTAALTYAGTTFFRDARGDVIAAKRGRDGTDYTILKPGMGEAALPWNWSLAGVSLN